MSLLAAPSARAATPAGPQPAGPTPTTQPAPPLPDKSQYTLFNPTPADQMRQLDTDRPNVTNTPHTIDAGHIQLEAGIVDYTYDRNEAPGVDSRDDTWNLGELNFRLGILNNLELNANINAYSSTTLRDIRNGSTVRASGFNDTVVGGKLNLWGDDGGDDDHAWYNALAIQPQFTLPTAARGVSTGHFQASVGLPFLMNLPDHYHLSIQPGFAYQRNTADSGYVTAFDWAVAIDRVVVGNFDAYVEYAAFPTTQWHVETVQTLDVGGTYPIGNNLQLDTGVFIGLNTASPTLEWTAGITARY